MGKEAASRAACTHRWGGLQSEPGLRSLDHPPPAAVHPGDPQGLRKGSALQPFGSGVLRQPWRCVSQVDNVSSLNLGE